MKFESGISKGQRVPISGSSQQMHQNNSYLMSQHQHPGSAQQHVHSSSTGHGSHVFGKPGSGHQSRDRAAKADQRVVSHSADRRGDYLYSVNQGQSLRKTSATP